MSTDLEPRLILEYLNELGYTGITSQQLKEFMRDLKKLIKHEARKAQIDENKQNLEYFYNYTSDPEEIFRSKEKLDVPEKSRPASDVFKTLYENKTIAAKAKEVPKKESVIRVEIHRAPQPKAREKSGESEGISSENIVCSERAETRLSHTSNKGTSTASVQTDLKDDDKENLQTNRPRTRSCTVQSRGSSLSRPKSSFIRPKIPVKSIKSDPVALYQHYQEEWKKFKTPGEDNRSKLRWVIREKMMGGGDNWINPLQPAESRKSTKV